MASPNPHTSVPIYCRKTKKRAKEMRTSKQHTRCPCDLCQRAVTQEIIHIAALLRQKLPPDVFPAILEYAQLQRTVRLTGVQNTFYCGCPSTQFLDIGFTIPTHIPRDSIREITIVTVCDIICQTPPRIQFITVPDEEFAWIEAVIKIPDDKKAQKQHSQSLTAQQALDSTTLTPLTPKYGSKRLATYPTGTQHCQKAVTSWTVGTEDSDTRKIIRNIQGGSTLEIRGFRKARPCSVIQALAEVEVRYAVVTKM